MSGKDNPHRMTVDKRGELERITRSGGQRNKPGSKPPSSSQANTASTTSSRFQSGISSLELLTPEEVLGQEYDCELVDYGSGDDTLTESDGETNTVMDTGRTSSLFGIVEPPGGQNKNQQQMPVESVDDEDYMLTRQIALFGDDETDSELGSDEERDIIKEIKAEITTQIKQEMAGELEHTRKKREREKQHEDHSDLADMEPKLREAYIKMRRLDKLLAKKMKKEKEVKRDRILLQRKLKKELEEIKPEGKELKEVTTNTQKFLALTLPDRHNEGVIIEEHDEGDDDEAPVTPVFPTQIPLDDTGSRGGERHDPARDTASQATTSGGASSKCSNETSYTSRSGDSQRTGTSATGTSSSSKGSRKKKDFIKRNIKLASDAANAIAMTDDEKKLLNDLLEDIDEMPEEDSASKAPSSQAMVLTGEGFRPAQEEMKRLENIDERLRHLLPPEDFQSIASSSPRSSPSQLAIEYREDWGSADDDEENAGESQASESEDRALEEEKEEEEQHDRTPNEEEQERNSCSEENIEKDPLERCPEGENERQLCNRRRKSEQTVLFTRTHPLDVDSLGDDVLKQTKEQRNVHERLKEIEDQLSHLTSTVELEIESPTLSEDQLNDLLDMCARTISRTTAETESITTARSEISRVSLLENPPKLADDVLKQLLDDARQQGITSRSTSHSTAEITEGDNNSAQMDNDTIRELLNNSRATSRTALSRPSSSSTATLTQESQERETWAQKQQQPPYQQQHHTPREPFLPKIDPKGSLITSSLSSMSTISSLSSSQHTPLNRSVVSLNQSVDSESHEMTGGDRGAGPSPPRYPHPPPRSGGGNAGGDGGRRYKPS